MAKRAMCMVLIALSIALVAGAVRLSRAGAADALKIVQGLEASWPDWFPSLDACPADVLPARDGPTDFSIERCSNSVEQCLDRCRANDASDCYAAALVLQRAKDGPVPQALFLKACTLGFVSGCTNRAASMDSGNEISCSIRTYRLACDRRDPWACTMTGFHLIRGIGVEKDDDRARKALSGSCRFGEGDDACAAARKLLKEIGN
jgi:TPR repeat protein